MARSVVSHSKCSRCCERRGGRAAVPPKTSHVATEDSIDSSPSVGPNPSVCICPTEVQREGQTTSVENKRVVGASALRSCVRRHTRVERLTQATECPLYALGPALTCRFSFVHAGELDDGALEEAPRENAAAGKSHTYLASDEGAGLRVGISA